MTVVFVDTETLGLDADIHPIWEVGLITPHQEMRWQLFVSPRDIELAHPKALEIGRFHERYREVELVDQEKFCYEFMHRLSLISGPAHLAGAVISFDEERLRRMFWKHEQPVCWHYHLLDVEAFAAGALGLEPPWDSEELSFQLGVVPADYERHTALGDARWAKAMYENALRIKKEK